MERIKIVLPEKSIFQTQLKVRISDINYGGHVGNDSILSMMHEARYRMLNHFGYASELDVEGLGFIQLDTVIQYKGESFHGDEMIINVFFEASSSKTFDLFYELKTTEKVIAIGKTGMGFFDYAARKLSNMPEAYLKKMQTS